MTDASTENARSETELKVKRPKSSAWNLHSAVIHSLKWKRWSNENAYSNFHIIYTTHNIFRDDTVDDSEGG